MLNDIIEKSFVEANNKLDLRLEKFRHLLAAQMVELKYGIGYRERFLKDFITNVNLIK